MEKVAQLASLRGLAQLALRFAGFAAQRQFVVLVVQLALAVALEFKQVQ